MKIVLLAVLTVLAGIGLVALILRWARANRHHDPIEYYRGWSSYRLPIVPVDKITKEEAEAQAAAGYTYYICRFDADEKLTRVIKMLRGAVSFDLVYTYRPNGKLKASTETRDGKAIVQEYDERGRVRPRQVARTDPTTDCAARIQCGKI